MIILTLHIISTLVLWHHGHNRPRKPHLHQSIPDNNFYVASATIFFFWLRILNGCSQANRLPPLLFYIPYLSIQMKLDFSFFRPELLRSFRNKIQAFVILLSFPLTLPSPRWGEGKVSCHSRKIASSLRSSQ
jgi:hypothetical protein